MKTRNLCAKVVFAVLAVALSLTASAQAATITWGAATDAVGPTDVLANGTYVDAVTNWTSDLTVNGVAFNHYGTATTPSVNGVNTWDLHYANGSNIVMGYESGPDGTNGPQGTDYEKLLAKSEYKSSPITGTVTLGGLTNGQEYQVQIWSAYWSPAFGFTIDGQNIHMGYPPQYLVGTFTADAGTQVISLAAGTDPYVFLPSAVSLRNVTSTIPEPGTLALLAAGLAGLLCYAWRKRK